MYALEQKSDAVFLSGDDGLKVKNNTQVHHA